jgi:hypothetical protein
MNQMQCSKAIEPAAVRSDQPLALLEEIHALAFEAPRIRQGTSSRTNEYRFPSLAEGRTTSTGPAPARSESE